MWNYRLVKHDEKDFYGLDYTWYAIHEAYYKEDGETVDMIST